MTKAAKKLTKIYNVAIIIKILKWTLVTAGAAVWEKIYHQFWSWSGP